MVRFGPASQLHASFTSLVARPFYGPATELRTLADAADFIANLPKHYSETSHWRLDASTVEAAWHSDRAKLVNSATEYMTKALVTEGMDRESDTPSSRGNGHSMNGRRLAKEFTTFVVSQFDSNAIANATNELKGVLVRAGDFVHVKEAITWIVSSSRPQYTAIRSSWYFSANTRLIACL
jgi:hypothetical protein